MGRNVIPVLIIGVSIVAFMVSCDNGTTSSSELSTLDKVRAAEEVVFPTFDNPSGAKSINSKVAEIYNADNFVKNGTDEYNTDYLDGTDNYTDHVVASEAYDYIQNINNNTIRILSNTILDGIQNKINQGENFSTPTAIEFETLEYIGSDVKSYATLQLVESENRIRFLGYVDLYVDTSKPNGVVNESDSGSPDYYEEHHDNGIVEVSFSSNMENLMVCMVSPIDTQKLLYDYTTSSGSMAFKSDDGSGPLYDVEKILSDSDNSLTFKRLSSKAEEEDYDIYMYSIYQKGIKHYFENGGSPVNTYYRYDGTKFDGSYGDGTKSALDDEMTTIISETPGAQKMFESMPSGDFDAPEFTNLETAHNSNF